MNTNEIILHFRCDNCTEEYSMPITDIVDKGTPICTGEDCNYEADYVGWTEE
jgi:hypothetical protein